MRLEYFYVALTIVVVLEIVAIVIAIDLVLSGGIRL